MTQSTKELNSAQSAKENAIAANEIAKNPYVKEKEKAEIANINADTAGRNLENKFQKETYNDRITQKFAQVEKDVAEGRISIDNSKFLMEYGITREEAIKLGAEGLKMIKDIIQTGIGAKAITQAKNELLKRNTCKTL